MGKKRNKKKKLMGYFYGGNINTPQTIGNMRISEEEAERANQAMQNVGRAEAVTSGLSTLASYIPGAGPLASIGINMVGGLVTNQMRKNAYPKEQYVPNRNTNRYGYNMGGQMPMIPQQGNMQLPGGQLQQQGNNMIVQGNNPQQDDGVALNNQVAVDHNEVIRGDKVFSDSLPFKTGSFAKEARNLARKEDKVKKKLAKAGIDSENDKEYKDGRHFERQANNLFNKQEQLAQSLGLRQQGPNGESMPVQQGFKFGGKMGYKTAGQLPPPKFFRDNRGNLVAQNEDGSYYTVDNFGSFVPYNQAGAGALTPINEGQARSIVNQYGFNSVMNTLPPSVEEKFTPRTPRQRKPRTVDNTPEQISGDNFFRGKDGKLYVQSDRGGKQGLYEIDKKGNVSSSNIDVNTLTPMSEREAKTYTKGTPLSTSLRNIGRDPNMSLRDQFMEVSGNPQDDEFYPERRSPENDALTEQARLNMEGEFNANQATGYNLATGPFTNSGIAVPTPEELDAIDHNTVEGIIDAYGNQARNVNAPQQAFLNARLVNPIQQAMLNAEQVPTDSTDYVDPTTETQNTAQSLFSGTLSNIKDKFKGSDLEKLGKEYGMGLAGDVINIANNLHGMAANKTRYIAESPIGAPELAMQERAIANASAGKNEMMNQISKQAAAARSTVGGRSMASRMANMRNITSGAIEGQSKVGTQYAQQLNQMMGNFGARRSAIQQTNLADKRMVEDINTREYDTHLTQGMQMRQNLGTVFQSQQRALNHIKNNTMLKGQMGSRDYDIVHLPDGTVKYVFNPKGAKYGGRIKTKGYKMGGTINFGKLKNNKRR